VVDTVIPLFAAHVSSAWVWLRHLLQVSTSLCVTAVSFGQALEPTAGQDAAVFPVFELELLHAAAPTNKTAPKNIIRFFIWIKPPVESVLTAGRMSHSWLF
jgi:hypothetical protein